VAGSTERVHLSAGRVALGVVLIVVVLVVWDRSLRELQNLFLVFPLYFVSVVAIMLGWAALASYPMRKVLKYVIAIGAWLFLFVLPILLLSLPPEVPPLAISFSGCAAILLIGRYEKWKKKRTDASA